MLAAIGLYSTSGHEASTQKAMHHIEEPTFSVNT